MTAQGIDKEAGHAPYQIRNRTCVPRRHAYYRRIGRRTDIMDFGLTYMARGTTHVRKPG